MEINDKIIELLNKSHCEYQVINNIKYLLENAGFIELKESEDYKIEKGKSYYITRNMSSILAFKVNEDISSLYYKIVASHSDSPALKIKENPTKNVSGYNVLKVEKYGGMIDSCWLDKPLGISGRVVYKKENSIESRLVDIDQNIAIIPNLAIHFNREINNGFAYNPQKDLMPILGISEDDLFMKLLEKTQKDGEEILSYDLYLFNREKAQYLGYDDQFITSPKLDDLACAYSSILGLLDSNNSNGIDVCVVFNNEEVGSNSINGADSDFLSSNLKRIAKSLGFNGDEHKKAIAKSFLISADNAHALHPNYVEKSDDKNLVLLNKGVVVKHNSNMAYTSDAFSSSVFKLIAQKVKIPVQDFYNRSDVRGGSTLGNISNSQISFYSVDIGIAQLAMHSNYEMIGKADLNDMYLVLKEFYSSNLEIKDMKANIK